MESDDRTIAIKRSLAAIAAALLGWLLYAVVQHGTQNAFIGLFADALYMLCKYLLMPFTFSGLLEVIIAYILNRIRGCCCRDIAVAALMLISLALAVFVTGPVIGAIWTVIATSVFLIIRLIRQYL